jgi:dienelactone hydrolase
MRTLLPALVLLLAIGLAACDDEGGGQTNSETSSSRPTSSTATPADQSFVGSVIQYESEGSGTITAGYLAPNGATIVPAVLLLHQYGGSRAQWAEFAPVLAREGYAVLVPDLDYDSEPAALFSDVRASLDYLKAQQGVDPGHAAIIGASYGANLAYVSSGLYPDLDTAIAISVDSRPDDDALVGKGLTGFTPRSVLFISDEAESPESATLANTVDDPVGVKIHVGQAAHGGKSAHGVELLENELVIPQILEWLALRFAESQ